MDKLDIIIVGASGMSTWTRTHVIKDFVSENLIDFPLSTYGTVSSFYPKNDSVVRNLLYLFTLFSFSLAKTTF